GPAACYRGVTALGRTSGGAVRESFGSLTATGLRRLRTERSRRIASAIVTIGRMRRGRTRSRRRRVRVRIMGPVCPLAGSSRPRSSADDVTIALRLACSAAPIRWSPSVVEAGDGLLHDPLVSLSRLDVADEAADQDDRHPAISGPGDHGLVRLAVEHVDPFPGDGTDGVVARLDGLDVPARARPRLVELLHPRRLERGTRRAGEDG